MLEKVQRLVDLDAIETSCGTYDACTVAGSAPEALVIALLAVFREQVINAVQNAFQSVTGAG